MNDDRLAQPQLEEALRSLGRTLATPTPGDYPARVLRRLAQEAEPDSLVVGSGRRPFRRWTTGHLVAAAAAVLVVAIALTLANPGARHAVASWFGFSGVDIRHAPSPTTPVGTPTTPAALDAGRKVRFGQAEQAAGTRVEVPAGLPGPDRIFLRRDVGSVVLTLAYRSAPPLKRTPDTGYALILTEIYEAGQPVFQKMMLTGAEASEVRVGDERGVFIEGPQEIMNVDNRRTVNGEPVFHEVAARASANTLIWSHGTTTYRLEGDFSQQEALGLADSID
jgi:hypothetical protein